MKKMILRSLILSIALLVTGQLKAQFTLNSFTLENTEIDPNTSIDSYITIQNQGADTLYLQVERTLVSMISAHEESFCFGPNCYPPLTPISSDPAIVAPGDIDHTFHATLLPHNTCGTSLVHYRFFDQNNTSDSIGIDLSFGFCTAAGISELAGGYGVTRPTRNPADGFTSFNYRLKNSDGQARIVVYNMLGSLIKSVRLQGVSGELVMSTSDLKPGLYLCSVVNNGRITDTYKLVVAHK